MRRSRGCIRSIRRALGLGDFGRGENYVARQVERWSKQYRASETETIDEMERLIAWLPAHLPPAAPVRLVHGDYRLDNVILAPVRAERFSRCSTGSCRRSAIRSPISPITSCSGTCRRPKPAPASARCVGHDLAALGIPARADYVDAYVARTGLDPAAASAGLSRLQFLPPRGDLAGHRRPRARRHGDERERRRHGADGAPARRKGVGVRAGGRRG